MVSKRAAAAVPQLLAAAFLAAQFSSIASPINEAGKRELTPDNPLTTPTQRIGAWATANVNISYKAGASTPSFLPPCVHVPNLDCLTDSNPIPFDPANASPVGRLIAAVDQALLKSS
jgi:hypothetical protein